MLAVVDSKRPQFACRRSATGRSRLGGRRHRKLIPGLLEPLESRVCLSSYYQYDVLARTGQGGLVSIEPVASINNVGRTAFVGSTSAGQSIHVVDTAAAGPRIISFPNPSATRTYGRELQINDSNRVAAIDTTTVGSARLARLWNSDTPGANTIIARSSIPRLMPSHFDDLGNFASSTNDGRLAFAGLEVPASGEAFWEVYLDDELVDRRDASNTVPEVAQIGDSTPAFFRVKAADGGKVVVANRQDGTTSIRLYSIDGARSSVSIASTGAGFTRLGIRPSISDDGNIVVFTGDRGNGLGVFASVQKSNGSRELVLVAGENATTPRAELGRDRPPGGDGQAQGQPIFFTIDTADMDSSVSVTNPGGGPVAPGDSFIVSFLATPSEASLPDPVTGVTFTANKGLWTTQVYADPSVANPNAIAFTTSVGVPVVQVGDVIGGLTIQTISVSDALATPRVAADGSARVAEPSDHLVAFTAITNGGTILVRAGHYGMTAAELREIMGTNLALADAERFIDAFNRTFLESAITTPKRQAAFLATVGHESAGLTDWTENPTTTRPVGDTVVRNNVVWTVYESDVTSYRIRRPLANGTFATKLITVTGPNFERYDNQQGNGPNEGRFYFGRGPLQITFRNAYAAVGTFLGINLTSNNGWELLSDRANRPDVGIRASGWFWSSYKRSSSIARWGVSLNAVADGVAPTDDAALPNTFVTATTNALKDQAIRPLNSVQAVNAKIARVIQGGYESHLDQRLIRFRRALRSLGLRNN